MAGFGQYHGCTTNINTGRYQFRVYISGRMGCAQQKNTIIIHTMATELSGGE